MTQIIVLALDGEAILLRNITVSVSLRLPDKDMSGQS
ncbi:baseplate complex protein, partial [Escherichia coli]